MTTAQPLLVEPQMLPLATPDQAEEFGEDDYGVYCRFRIGEVQFALRWIAPGTFIIGSPENERAGILTRGRSIRSQSAGGSGWVKHRSRSSSGRPWCRPARAQASPLIPATSKTSPCTLWNRSTGTSACSSATTCRHCCGRTNRFSGRPRPNGNSPAAAAPAARGRTGRPAQIRPARIQTLIG